MAEYLCPRPTIGSGHEGARGRDRRPGHSPSTSSRDGRTQVVLPGVWAEEPKRRTEVPPLPVPSRETRPDLAYSARDTGTEAEGNAGIWRARGPPEEPPVPSVPMPGMCPDRGRRRQPMRMRRALRRRHGPRRVRVPAVFHAGRLRRGRVPLRGALLRLLGLDGTTLFSRGPLRRLGWRGRRGVRFCDGSS